MRWLEAATRTLAEVRAVNPLARVLVGAAGAWAAGWGLARFVGRSGDPGADVGRPRVSAQVPLPR